MTQIEPTNEDVAEALRLMGRPERIISAALALGVFTLPERNFARTIAKLRVAREALEAANKAATTMRNSSKLVGQYPNDPKRNQDWVKARYHDGRDIHAITKPALAQITQEAPNAG